jgi:phi LC3 family holin
MGINWLVRIKNKAWWLAIVPALCILAQAVLSAFNITWDYAELSGKIAAIIEAVFAVLVLCGVVLDPTTEGFGDSERALTYEEPAPNTKEVKQVEAETDKDPE